METWKRFKITDETVRACRNEAGFQMSRESKAFWNKRADFLEEIKGKDEKKINFGNQELVKLIVDDINKLDYNI